MNKPDKMDKKYLTSNGWQGLYCDKDLYYKDLEEYCEELEKALNKACKKLDYDYSFSYASRIHPMTKEDWKEWCMRD